MWFICFYQETLITVMTQQWHVVWSSPYSPVLVLMSGTWLTGTQMNWRIFASFKLEFWVWSDMNIMHQSPMKPFFLPPPTPKGLLRSTVNPQTAVMAVGSSMCWRSCPPLSSVMFFNQPGTSLMVGAPLATEGPWGRPPLLWLFPSWLMWEGWAPLCSAHNL